MYLYSITLNIDNDVHDEWLQWMKATFLPAIFSTQLFVEKKFLQMLNEEKTDGTTTYSLQLFLKSEEDFKNYEENYSYDHQVLMYSKYSNKIAEFRTLLKQIDL